MQDRIENEAIGYQIIDKDTGRTMIHQDDVVLTHEQAKRALLLARGRKPEWQNIDVMEITEGDLHRIGNDGPVRIVRDDTLVKAIVGDISSEAMSSKFETEGHRGDWVRGQIDRQGISVARFNAISGMGVAEEAAA